MATIDSQALRTERDGLKARLTKVERLLAAVEEYERNAGPASAPAGAKPDYRGRVRAVMGTKTMTVNDVIGALANAGQPIQTTDPYRTIYKVLKGRPQDFEKKGEKWAVKKTAQNG